MAATLAERLAIMALALGGAAGADADVIDDYLALQLGSWSSAAQAAADPAYGTAVWHLVEVPWVAQPGRWVYVESWMEGADRPYLQRIARLLIRADGAIVATRYTLPEPGRFVGGYRFRRVPPAQLCLTPAGAPLPDVHCESRAPAPPDLAD